MEAQRLLPDYLVRRYHGWKATTYRENRAWLKRLAVEGQRPREMVITCCDSRLHVGSMFGSDADDLFVHRNIAGLVPEAELGNTIQSTSASVEFAVTVLRVSHILVLGHSQCGGIRSAVDLCRGTAPDLAEEGSFIGRWLDGLRPAYECLPAALTPEDAAAALERRSVVLSLTNLMTYPKVRRAVEDEDLSLHGLWIDIEDGRLEVYDTARERFVAV